MTKQEQINNFIAKLQDNGRKFDALEKRRKQGEFPPDDFAKFRQYEQLRLELTNEWKEICRSIEAAGLHEYFLEHDIEGY